MSDSITERNCANCACSELIENKLQPGTTQLFCRRNPASAMQFRAERPRLINNEMTIDRKTQKPVMETFQDVAYLYQPTQPSLVCFDGWRPMGALPGPDYQNWLPDAT